MGILHGETLATPFFNFAWQFCMAIGFGVADELHGETLAAPIF
jgi:hypothetical protein